MPKPQTYQNHAHRPWLSNTAGAAAGIALGLLAIEATRQPNGLTLGVLSLAFAVLVLVSISRVYIVRLQDRIILLEMRVRLARLGREAEYGKLTKRQLIALRFASDAELPSLIHRAVTENLGSREIKEAIQDWQPDYHRA